MDDDEAAGRSRPWWRVLRPASALWPVLALEAALLVGLGASVGNAFELSNRCRFGCGVFAGDAVRAAVLLAPVVVPCAGMLAVRRVSRRGGVGRLGVVGARWVVVAVVWASALGVGAGIPQVFAG